MSGDPINRLFFAINHYVSTGDHIGEGIALDGAPGERILFIPIRPRELEDLDNYAKFEARIDQLRHAKKTSASLAVYAEQGEFRFHALTIEASDMDHLAELLKESPGPLGWGSCKATIDANFA